MLPTPEHDNEPGGYTRQFTVDPATNRLRGMQIGVDGYDYAFDANGNMRSETTSRHFEWNHTDQLKAFRTQIAGAEPSIHAHYLYDAAGQRVKKLVRKQGGLIETTHYIDEVFEHHHWSATAQEDQNNHLHVTDDQQRIVLVRLGPAHRDDRGGAVQFNLDDHLKSNTVVIDESGEITNREEYAPYGDTTFGTFTRKRYRFTGQERDEESGLAYHSARYYSPPLARWASADPAGTIDGCNLYRYCRSNPMSFADSRGLDAQSTTGAVLESSENSDRPLTEGDNLLWDRKQQTWLLYDEATAQQSENPELSGRAYFKQSGDNWIVDESQIIFVSGKVPPPAAPTQSILERYRTGVFNGLTAIPRAVKEAGAQVVDMATMYEAVRFDIPESASCFSNTCEAYNAGVSQSALLYDATVGLVERPARALAKVIELDPEAVGELAGGAYGAYGLGSWLRRKLGMTPAAATAADEIADTSTAKTPASGSGPKPTPEEPKILTDPDPPPGAGGPYRTPDPPPPPPPAPDPPPDPWRNDRDHAARHGRR
jgi:RHS repeat-associated protein